MNPPPQPEPESLLRHIGWIQELARSLVADPVLAEDLSQEACIAALEQPPPRGTSMRGWLTGVLRNLARQEFRSQGRRTRREEVAARGEALEPSADVVLRAERHRYLVEQVMALEDPFRQTVLMRYFDGLPQREIARRLGVKATTVNSRLTRGLARLRERLDEDHGTDGAHGALFLAPLLARGRAPVEGAPGPAATTTFSGKLAALACGLVLVVGGLGLYWGTSGANAPAAPEDAPLAVLHETAPARGGAPGTFPVPVSEQQPDLRTDAARTVPSVGAATPAAESRLPLRGRVLGPDGHPLSGVGVRFFEEARRAAEPREEELATSRADGRFELAVAAPRGRVAAFDPRFATLFEGDWSRGTSLTPCVVVAPAAAVDGRVVDEQGRELAGAVVRLVVPEAVSTAAVDLLDASAEQHWVQESGARGRFGWEAAPATEEVELLVTLEGYAPFRERLLGGPLRGRAVVLTRPVHEDGVVRGQVLDPDGRPVAEAFVGLGLRTTVSDGDGMFAIGTEELEPGVVLRAVAPGYQPAEEELLGAPPEFVYLQLGPPPLSISGRVVDEGGQPVAGARVWLVDPSPLDVVAEEPAHVEHLLSTSANRGRYHNIWVSGERLSDADTSQVGPPADWSWVETDPRGGFVLDGLMQRAYRLGVLDGETLLGVETEPLAAGARDVELVLPTSGLWPELKGRVVTRAGDPVVGAEVVLSRRTALVELQRGPSRITVDSRAQRPARVTDEEGRFRFERVRAEDPELAVAIHGDSVVPTMLPIGELRRGETLELVVDVRFHLRVELDDPELADRFRVLNADGEPLALHVLRADSHNLYTAASIPGGRSAVLVVPQGAKTLELFLGDELVEQVPLALIPGRVNVIRP